MNGGVGRRPAAHRGPTRYTPRERSFHPTAPTTPTALAAPAAAAPKAAASKARAPKAAASKALAAKAAPPTDAVVPPARSHRGLLRWRRANRRITVENHSLAVWIVDRLAALARRLLVLGKILAALIVLAAAIAVGRLGVKHVVESPRFSVRDFRIGPTNHVSHDDIIDRTGVALGSRLLALDTDQIAARLTRHPWIASARVRRELPTTLVIDVTERRAGAVAVIGGLYLIDEQGHPFKPATLEETDGLVVITGISRREYANLPRASEGAFREALALYAEYQDLHRAAATARPPLSEIHIDPRTGFSLVLYDGGGEIRLGRIGIADKLARLDQILADLGPRGALALRVVHLDGKAGDRVPIMLVPSPGSDPAPPPAPLPAAPRPAKPSP
jgi:cell division protein FtsQ